jgi:hypothetical protein
VVERESVFLSEELVDSLFECWGSCHYLQDMQNLHFVKHFVIHKVHRVFHKGVFPTLRERTRQTCLTTCTFWYMGVHQPPRPWGQTSRERKMSTRQRRRNPGWHPGLGMSTIRIRQGLDQIEFAALLEKASNERWDQSKVSRLETGELRMTVDRLKVIAQLQGMSYEWYIDGPKGNEAKGVYVTSRRSIAAA